jgi:hypothetical protein
MRIEFGRRASMAAALRLRTRGQRNDGGDHGCGRYDEN